MQCVAEGDHRSHSAAEEINCNAVNSMSKLASEKRLLYLFIRKVLVNRLI